MTDVRTVIKSTGEITQHHWVATRKNTIVGWDGQILLHMKVKIKRVYEPAVATDGYRILIDRLWPRGIKKEETHIDKWLKEVAPSTALRKWFNHDPERWHSFSTRYQAELLDSTALEELCADARKHKNMTLLFGAKDAEHNHAVVLLQMIEGKI